MESHTGGGRGIAARRRARRAPAGRRLTRKLARADLRAVSEVRHALRDLLDASDRSACADTAELLTSELVTNALVHTAHDAVVTATVEPRGIRVEVRDFVDRRPRRRTPIADEHTGGRGLGLVQTLADSWGVRALDVGKIVWFELGTAQDTAHACETGPRGGSGSDSGPEAGPRTASTGEGSGTGTGRGQAAGAA